MVSVKGGNNKLIHLLHINCPLTHFVFRYDAPVMSHMLSDHTDYLVTLFCHTHILSHCRYAPFIGVIIEWNHVFIRKSGFRAGIYSHLPYVYSQSSVVDDIIYDVSSSLYVVYVCTYCSWVFKL